MSSTARQQQTKTVSEVRNCAVSFASKLNDGEVLTGTPTVTVSPAGPTLSSKAVNSAEIRVNGTLVAIGGAVQFLITGGTANTTYTLTVSCATNASPAQTLIGYCTLLVET